MVRYLIGFFGACAFSAAGLGEVVARYTVTVDPVGRRLGVDMTLTGLDPSLKSVDLRLFNGFAYIRLEEPLILGPDRATAGSATVEIEHPGPYRWEAPTAGAEEIALSYAIPMRHRLLPQIAERDSYEWPYLDHDHGLLSAPTMLLLPTGLELSEARIRFEVPEGWACIAPWPEADGEHSYEVRDVKSLQTDYVVVGDWSMREVAVGDFTATIAVSPGQDALEDVVVEPIARIVAHQREMFDRPGHGRYLFVFGRPETHGAAGSPKANSMTLVVEARLLGEDLGYLPHLIAHEFWHTWEASLYEAHPEMRWHTEGVTDYFAYLTIAQLGLTPWEGLADRIGSLMLEVERNPRFGRLSLADAGGDVFFTDRDAYELVYKAGLLSAAWLDMAVRTQSPGRTLLDLERAFINDPRWGQSPPALGDYLEAAGSFISEAHLAHLRAMLTEPYAESFEEAFAAVGVELTREAETSVPRLRANLRDATVVDLDPSGLAWAVGIRENDRFLSVNGREIDNPSLIRTYWAMPEGGRIRAVVERDGERIEIDGPIPQSMRYVVPSSPWSGGG